MNQSSLSIQQIVLSPDSSQLLLKITPIYTEISADDIINLLNTPSLPSFKLNLDGIESAVTALASLHDVTEDEAVTFAPIVIADKQDALLDIVISDDALSASATITTAHGGASITLNDIKNKCDQLGLKFGLLTKNVFGLLNICKDAKPGKVYKINIANGRPPIDGINARFEKLVSTESHRKPTPKLLENGKVDMHDLGQSITVKANTVLMKKIPMFVGKPGKTVTAEIIEQKKAIDYPFIINQNVKVNPNDPLQLISTSYGIPIDKDGFIKIDDVLLIENVDNRSGNVIYDGTVVITADIHENMKVKASGDITVLGLIESADVTCGGDLTVEMPIIGRHKKSDEHFSCEIKCGGNLIGTIAQYASLSVAKNISLSSQLIHCKTECKGKIEVHNKSLSQGAIIGGTTESHQSVTTVTVGTSGSTKTTINLISEAKQLELIKNKCIKEIQLFDKMINQFKKAESKADSIPDIASRKKTKKQIFLEKQQYRDRSDQVQKKLATTKVKLEQSYQSTYLSATKKLYSDTIVNVDSQDWSSTQEYGPSTVSIINHQLQISHPT
ncbi:FapA family protein [Psychromonas sp. SP041]|uniref:DUF342 domain-containing protein n=1 Tax=Psychromonas sp. SP041 TaxID=1365007 RepID=UPI00041E00E1|nr:FapA family protein [Psychromonas sp. SP041]